MEVWVKRVKHIGNEEETSEGASIDAFVASFKTAGRWTHPRRGERERERQRVQRVEQRRGNDEKTTEYTNGEGRSVDTPACCERRQERRRRPASRTSGAHGRTKRPVAH